MTSLPFPNITEPATDDSPLGILHELVRQFDSTTPSLPHTSAALLPRPSINPEQSILGAKPDVSQQILSPTTVQDMPQSEDKRPPLRRRPYVYFASKLVHAPLWRDYKIANLGHFDVVSTWHDDLDVIRKDNDDEAACLLGWKQNIVDVGRATHLVAMGAREDRLNGTLVEIGMAMRRGIPILLTGSYPWGTWRFLHGVMQFPDIVAVLEHLKGTRA